MIYRFGATRGKREKLLFVAILLFLVSPLLVACRQEAREQALFPALKAWDLKSLRITDGANRVLMFQRKNCVWTLGPEGLAADEALVTDLADRIVGLSFRRGRDLGDPKEGKARSPLAHDSFRYRIDLGLAAGKSKTLYLGGGEGPTPTHVRTTDDEKTYGLGRAAIKSITMDPDFWRARGD